MEQPLQCEQLLLGESGTADTDSEMKAVRSASITHGPQSIPAEYGMKVTA